MEQKYTRNKKEEKCKSINIKHCIIVVKRELFVWSTTLSFQIETILLIEFRHISSSWVKIAKGKTEKASPLPCDCVFHRWQRWNRHRMLHAHWLDHRDLELVALPNPIVVCVGVGADSAVVVLVVVVLLHYFHGYHVDLPYSMLPQMMYCSVVTFFRQRFPLFCVFLLLLLLF